MRTQSRLRAQTVLVVDDDVMLARIIGQVLQRYGLKVSLAHSFAEALDHAGTHRVGVFDIDLGDGSGVDLAERMLQSGHVVHSVFFTGGANPMQLARARSLGAVVSKSDGPTAVVDTVLEAMGRQTPAPAASS